MAGWPDGSHITCQRGSSLPSSAHPGHSYTLNTFTKTPPLGMGGAQVAATITQAKPGTRVATKVGFYNFAKYEISRNKLLISRNFAKFFVTNFAKFRQGI
jgi:hypothetical protein